MIITIGLWTIVVAVILYILGTEQSNWANWIAPVFFLSGIPALVYQIVWQRALFAFFGSDIQSVTIIVTIFIVGLGLGSVLSGKISSRIELRLPVFALIEIAIGLFGLISLPLFRSAAGLVSHLSGAGTVAMTVAVLLPPTMLMGATLPMLVAHISSTDPVGLGRSVGRLYFANTLGSAIACFMCAQFAMGILGERKMTMSAAAINFAIGFFVLMRSKSSGSSLQIDARIAPGKSGPELLVPPRIAWLLAWVSGFIALAYEIIWYRIYSFADGGRAPGFAFVLGAYLGGLAYGSLVAESLCRKSDEGKTKLGLGTVGTAVIVFNILAFLVAPILGGAVRLFGASITLVLVAVSAGCLGSIFPLIANFSISPGRDSGSGVGVLYFSNMLGAACGSFCVGYVLFDVLSLRAISTVLAVGGILCGTAILTAAGKIRTAIPIGAVAATLVMVLSSRFYDRLYEKLLFKGSHRPDMGFTEVLENRNGVITVTKEGAIFGGGVYDGYFNTELTNDSNAIFRCFAISSFHPAPKKILMIGLSSGSWAQVLANHPQVEELEIVEINPGYLRIIPKYEQVASILSNSIVNATIDDGRRWLRRNPKQKFDLIVMNTTYYWRAQSTNLLSVEFLALIREHLAEGGMFFYNTTSSAEAQLTGVTVFPYGLRVGNFLAVSDRPIMLDGDRLRHILIKYRINGRPVLDPSNPEDVRILNGMLLMLIPADFGEEKKFNSVEFADSIRRRYRGRRIMTDDNMGSEWSE